MSYLGIEPANQRASQNRVIYAAGAGQTSFAAVYSAPDVDVYQNGSKLVYGVDFVATNGTTVVLTVGAALNDDIEIVSIKTSNPYDNYTKSQIDALQGIFYAVAGGSVDALAVTTTPLIPALVNGIEVRLRVSGPNTTTTPTVTFSNLGVAKTITTQGNQILPVGAWATNQEITLRYNQSTDKLEWITGVGPATSAEVLSGTSPNKAITPLSFLSQWTGSNQSLTPNGYQKIPGGLIVQWGSSAIAGSTSTTVALPISFPTAFLRAFATCTDNNLNDPSGNAAAANSSGLSNITLFNSDDLPRTVQFLAIGY